MNLQTKLRQLSIEENSANCKDKIYKARVSQFSTKRGIGFTVYLEERVKLSCPGCEACGWIPDTLQNYVAEGGNVLGLEEAEDGQLYTIGMCNVSYDRETGYADDWDLELIPLPGDGKGN